MTRRQDPEIREFILWNVEKHPDSIAKLAGEEFGLSRAGIGRYMARLIEEDLLEAEGNTRSRRYKLRDLEHKRIHLDRTALWAEDEIWRNEVLPLMKNVKPNIIDLFQYGFTEMFNNIIDHSQSPDALIRYEQTYTAIKIGIYDVGIGIFNKIKEDFRLADIRTALLELSKGKLTSDKKRHSGEGIYFTSRMFDRFTILSSGLCYTRAREEDDEWLIGTREKEDDSRPGTLVKLAIRTNANWTVRDIFDKYQGDDIYFRKTHVPLALGRYPGEQLVSRSQAKRILARLTNFSEVILDFKDVHEIGQSFADEIFRVFKNEHPHTPIYAVRTNENIDKMIRHVQGDKARSSDA